MCMIGSFLCSQGYHISGWREIFWRIVIVMCVIVPAVACGDFRTTTACGASTRYVIGICIYYLIQNIKKVVAKQARLR